MACQGTDKFQDGLIYPHVITILPAGFHVGHIFIISNSVLDHCIYKPAAPPGPPDLEAAPLPRKTRTKVNFRETSSIAKCTKIVQLD